MPKNGKGETRYKINGEYVYLPTFTKAEQKKRKQEYMKKWIAENPEKVKGNTDRYRQNMLKKYNLNLKG